MTFFLCQAKGAHSRLALQECRPLPGDQRGCTGRQGSPGGASGKEPVCKCRRERRGSIPGSGRSPRGGHGSPLQPSRLENPTDTGAWGAAVHGVAKGRTLSHRQAGSCFLLSVSKGGAAAKIRV